MLASLRVIGGGGGYEFGMNLCTYVKFVLFILV